jgi:hypothetical protein
MSQFGVTLADEPYEKQNFDAWIAFLRIALAADGSQFGG